PRAVGIVAAVAQGSNSIGRGTLDGVSGPGAGNRHLRDRGRRSPSSHGRGLHLRSVGTQAAFSICMLSLAITLVLAIIVDVDRPREGLIRVSQQSLLDLQKQLHSR